MDESEVIQLYHTAWNHWGAEAQINICIEEMAELTQAFLKARRNGVVFSRNVYQELADVSICIDQITRRIEETVPRDPVNEEIEFKLNRLKERLMKSMGTKYPMELS